MLGYMSKLEGERLTEKHYSIGEFAKEVQVTTKTLRRWDQNGILTAHRNPKNNRRYYTESDLFRVPVQKKMYHLPSLMAKEPTLMLASRPVDQRDYVRATKIYGNVKVMEPKSIGYLFIFEDPLLVASKSSSKQEMHDYVQWLQAGHWPHTSKRDLLKKRLDDPLASGNWDNVINYIKESHIKNVVLSSSNSWPMFIIGITKLYQEFGNSINYWDARINDNSWMSIQAGLGGAKLITNPETYSLVKKAGD